MGRYLYCIAPPRHVPPPALQGIADAPVEALPIAGLSLWTSHLAAPPSADLDAIRRHNLVVEAATTDAITPLPLRFGQWAADADRLAAPIAERAEDYLRLLGDFAGALEFGLRLLDTGADAADSEADGPAPAPAPTGSHGPAAPGRTHLETVARKLHRRDALSERGEAVAAELRRRLGSLVRRESVAPLPTSHGLVSIAHLVGRHDFSPYRQTVAAFRGESPELRLLLSGPWPPYSFVT
jgi:hypothetical protein